MIQIELFYNTFIILFILIFSVTALIFKMKKEKRMSIWYIGIFEVYLLLILKIAVLPIKIVYDEHYYEALHGYIEAKNYYQMIPFHTILEIIKNGVNIEMQIWGNVLLLLPLPIFLSFIMKKATGLKVVLISCCFSIGIEAIQLIINVITRYPNRIIDIDDVILNIIGIIAGWGIYLLVKRVKPLYLWLCNHLIYVAETEE